MSSDKIVDRLEIGLKLDGSAWLAPDFLSSGSTSASLKHVGNRPSRNDRLVSLYNRSTELWTQSTSVEKKLCDDFFNNALVIHLSLLRLSSTLDYDYHDRL